MATTTGQRIGIWVIAIAMTVGTVLGFIAMIIGSQNQTTSQAALSKYQSDYTAYTNDLQAQQTDVEKRANALSKKYYKSFSAYKKKAGAFKASGVKKLSVKQLKAGKGKVISDDTAYLAYYIGWNPKGKTFDSSLDGKKLKAPLIAQPGSGLITGWTNGLKGKKIGGVYELTIPSDQAYAEQGKGDDIPPNTPLKFIVMPIEIVKTLKEPAIPAELLSGYGG